MTGVETGGIGLPDVDEHVGQWFARFYIDDADVKKLQNSGVRLPRRSKDASDVQEEDRAQVQLCSVVWGGPRCDNMDLLLPQALGKSVSKRALDPSLSESGFTQYASVVLNLGILYRRAAQQLLVTTRGSVIEVSAVCE